MQFIREIEQYMQQHNMIGEGERIVLGVSGGADSVCLLLVLCSLQKKYNLSLSVVHVHHGIRGRAADEDAAFVRGLCEQKGIPCRVVCENVPELAKRQGRSKEEMGRIVRYRAFECMCQETGAHRIAVAHNRNDNAETFLFHAMRGSGMTGLCGILPCRDKLIRPLLAVSRAQIEAYLVSVGQEWREDVTNQTMDYARNRIRNGILKIAEEQINEQAVAHLAAAAGEVAEAEELLMQMTETAWEKACLELCEEKLVLDGKELCTLAPILRRRVFQQALCLLAGQCRDVDRVHLEALCKLNEGRTGRRISLPHGLTAEKEYDRIKIFRSRNCETIADCALTELPAEIPLPEGILHVSVQHVQKIQEIPKNTYTKWFDYDKIDGALRLRGRQEGDYLVIHADGRKKMLKSMLIDAKITREKREQMRLLACGSRVLWAVGFRADEGLHVDENTKRILVAELRKRG